MSTAATPASTPRYAFAPAPLANRRPGSPSPATVENIPEASAASPDSIVARVRIVLAPPTDIRVRAYASIELSSGIVLRDVRIVDTGKARPMVAMPSRPKTVRCPHCRVKVAVTAAFCGKCGARQPDQQWRMQELERAKYVPPDGGGDHDYAGPGDLHIDVAFPCTREARGQIDEAVLAEYERARAEGGAA
jgi:DNA-binding cell septation regulator SpoVG